LSFGCSSTGAKAKDDHTKAGWSQDAPISLEDRHESVSEGKLDLHVSRPQQAAHYPSQALRLEATVTNRGPGEVVVPLNQQGFEVMVNERWYSWEHSWGHGADPIVPDETKYSPLEEGQSRRVEMALTGTGYPSAGRWYEKGDFQTLGRLPMPLRLSAGGEYTIRIALPVKEATQEHQSHSRVVSAPIRVRFADGEDEFKKFMDAVESGDIQSVAELLRKHPYFAQARDFWKIPLNTAIIEDHLEVAITLLDAGANPNEQDVISGYTALHHAVRSTRGEMVDILLGHGAYPRIRNYLKMTPFGLAILRSNYEAAHRLMPDDAGSRLWAQIAAGDIEAVRQALNQQPELAQSHLEGAATPLHLAVEKGRMEIARLLLSSGADINATEFMGWTPLIVAAYYGQLECAKLLLEHGAAMDIKTHRIGMTALDYAKRHSHNEIVALLTHRIQ
jgi:ankyrin repeat protein